MNIKLQTAAFWYSQYQSALMGQSLDMADEYLRRYHYWKRRADLHEYLSELCEQKEFDNGRK